MKVVACMLLLIIADAAVAADTVSPMVRVVTDEASRKSCQYLGMVTVRKAMGPNKAGGALKKAFAKVAELGGNGLYLVNQSQNLFDGASATGEALKCPSAAVP